jgi:hypothetical protein
MLRLLVATLVLMIFLNSCSSEQKKLERNIQTEQIDPSTAKMIDLIESIRSKIDPMQINYYKNSHRAGIFQSQIDNPNIPANRKLEVKVRFGYELLMAGKNTEAIVALEKGLAELMKIGDQGKNIKTLKRLLALCYMRIGEQENCIAQNNKNSCILPIVEDAVYTLKSGPETAIGIYKELLSANPKDYESIWMLNIAYMTIGAYPQEVPKQFLITPDKFKSDVDINAFVNNSKESKVNTIGLSGGSILEDLDNDGDIDIVASSWNLDDPIKVFANNGDGTFEDVSDNTKLGKLPGGLNMIHADYNNDGLEDILILRGAWFAANGKFPNSLLQNMGDLTFKDVTAEVGLVSLYPTQTASFTDFNNDGWLDLIIGNESTSKIVAPSELYINDSGEFKHYNNECGLGPISYFVKGVSTGDIDNDGDQDLFISIMGGANKLYRNDLEGNKFTFTDISSESNITGPIGSFATWMWDFNHDGALDILVLPYDIARGEVAMNLAKYFIDDESNIEKIGLYKNQNGSFINVASQYGMKEPLYAMGSNFGDIDNDGYQDMYLGTGSPSYSSLAPNKMYLNGKGRNFLDVTSSSRLGHLQKGHGVSFGDIDNDGDLDIFHVLGGAFEGDVFLDALFLNPGYSNNAWINIKCRGTKSNKSAIGAKIIVKCVDPVGKKNTFYHVVNSGGSFGSSSLIAEIGLGNNKTIESIEIIWPNKEQSSDLYENPPINKFIEIIEGASDFSVLK